MERCADNPENKQICVKSASDRISIVDRVHCSIETGFLESLSSCLYPAVEEERSEPINLLLEEFELHLGMHQRERLSWAEKGIIYNNCLDTELVRVYSCYSKQSQISYNRNKLVFWVISSQINPTGPPSNSVSSIQFLTILRSNLPEYRKLS